MKKPNFFIIGAPKCGTTSLATWLAEHPEVFFCPEKEPHFFSTDVWQTTESLENYEALFAGANESHRAVGEASTHYIYSELALREIERYSPGAKFIVCLRNPAEMAPSVHAERVFAGMESQQSFEKAWRLNPARQSGKSVPLAVRDSPLLVDYQRLCSVGELLRKTYEVVPKDRVLPVFLDDVKQDPAEVYATVLDFLELSPSGKVSFAVANARKHTARPRLAQAIRLAVLVAQKVGLRSRFGIAARIRDRNIHSATDQRARRSNATLGPALVDFFRDDVTLLEELTGRDLSSWTSTAS